MGNALYELASGRVRPYFGGGIGTQYVHEPSAVSSSGGVVVSVEGGAKPSFAYQVIAGAGFPIGGGLSFTADYRFMSLVGSRQQFAVGGWQPAVWLAVRESAVSWQL